MRWRRRRAWRSTLIPVLMGYLIRGRIPERASQPAQPRADRGLPAAAECGAACAEADAGRRRAAGPGGEPVAAAAHRRRVHAAARRRRPAVHAVGAARPVGRQGGRAAAADRPADQDRARGRRACTARPAAPRPRPIRRRSRCSRPRSSSSRAISGGPGMTPDKLVEELDRIVQVPGLANIWVPPIRNRIDMLATGIKSPVGVKVAGTDLATIDRLTGEIERALKDVPGVSSALAERLTGGRYVDVDDRPRCRRALRHEHRRRAVGRSPRRSAARTSARRSRACSASRSTCAIRARLRDSLEKLRAAADRHRTRRADGAVRRGRRCASPTARRCCRSENARLSGWVYVDIRGRDLKSAVQDMQRVVAEQGEAAAGLLGLVVGPVRVPRARDGEAQGRRAVHAADHLRAAVPDLQALRRGAADHGDAAVRAGRRHLAAVPARATTCRSPARWASSRWPACRPSSA